MDFNVSNHGSIWLLQPVSVAAQQWVADHIPEDAPTIGTAVAVEHRFIDNIVAGFRADGLTDGEVR
jgi:hypothetical protein